MDDVLHDLTSFWKGRGVAAASKQATVAEIEAWERQYNVILPSDLRDYVLRVNGILRGETLEFDHEGISFLPLSAMCPEDTLTESEPRRHDSYIFADFLVKCHWWCAALDDLPHEKTRIFIGGGLPTQNRLVANSLAEFFELYMNDHLAIYPLPLEKTSD